MSEPASSAASPSPQSAADSNGQLIVSLTTVVVLGGIAGGLIFAGMELKGATEAWVGVATIIGVLGNSLNAPTGIGNVIRGAIGKAGTNS